MHVPAIFIIVKVKLTIFQVSMLVTSITPKTLAIVYSNPTVQGTCKHAHTCTYMHIHTHTHTSACIHHAISFLLLAPSLSNQYAVWVPPLMLILWTTSFKSFMLSRSLVTRSIYLNGVPALGLIFPFSVLYILSLDPVSIFLKTCPSHWSVRCISLLSIGTSLALFWMFSFLIWTHLVTLGYHGHRYSTSYGMFSTCSSLSHPHTPVSASYNSSDMVGV